jgi:tRNA U54 and U55 pseudouridine synthase Pus10
MADVDEELTPVIAGRNFGTITDIEINPYDGKIYVVSLLDEQSKKGKIYQAYPKSQQQKQQQQQENLMTKSLSQQSIQQQIPSSISQEQIHQ